MDAGVDGRDVAQVEVGRAVGRRLVARGRHHAVPVRVDDVAVHEGLTRQVGAVEVARRDQHLPGLVVDEIPIDVDVTDLVVGLDLLERVVGLHEHTGVPQTGVVDGSLVAVDHRLLLGGRDLVEGRVVELLGLDGVELEGVARGADVPVDVGGFLGEFVRTHHELLNQRRVDGAERDRHERPQADRDDREHPPAPVDVPQEEDRGDDRDDDEQVQRGELRMDVGVARAFDHSACREVELEATEIVLRGLDQGHRRENEREVCLHLRGDALERGLEADPAVEVVRERGDEQHDDEPAEEPLGDELQERQLEDVEADVFVELRILDVERDVVDEQHPLLPLRRHADAEDEREEERDADADPTRVARGRGLVAPDQLVFGAGRPVLRRQPVGNHEVGEHQHEEDRGEHQRGHDLRREQAAPRAPLAERIEPEEVGVEAREASQAEQQQEQRDDRADDPATQAEATTGLSGGDAHRRAAYVPGRMFSCRCRR